MTTYRNKSFDEERALYGSRGVEVLSCRFDGPADGESALKESKDILVRDTYFNLRYPFWHDENLKIENCDLTELCRAALWYSSEIRITDSRLHGIKALRECADVSIEKSDIVSPEFGWSVHGIRMKDSSAESEYFMMRSDHLEFDHVSLKGKYSFQYIDGLEIKDSLLDTKDAFWHSKNVTVKNSTVKGEYLGWFSDGLTLIDCKISGNQPLCYCENLKLINCTMKDADLAFEYSDVTADIRGHIASVKNPKSGTITVDSVGEIIHDDPVMECTGRVVIR